MNKTHYKQATALTLVVTLVLCQGFVTGTPLTQIVSKVQRYVARAGTVLPTRSDAKLPRAAQLSVKGAVTLNGLSASNGATVFSGAGVQTKEDSSATLSFGRMGQVELTSASDFTLAVEGTTLGGQLRAGRATIVAPAGVAVKIVTADGPILTDGKDAVVLTVDVTSGKTRVESRRSLAGVTTPAGVERQATDQQDVDPKLALEKAENAHRRILQMQGEARKAKDVIKLNCVNEKLLGVKQLLNIMDAAVDDLTEAKSKGDQAAIDDYQVRIKEASQKIQNSLTEAEQCIGESNFNIEEPLGITAAIIGTFAVMGELLNDPPGEPEPPVLSPIF